MTLSWFSSVKDWWLTTLIQDLWTFQTHTSCLGRFWLSSGTADLLCFCPLVGTLSVCETPEWLRGSKNVTRTLRGEWKIGEILVLGQVQKSCMYGTTGFSCYSWWCFIFLNLTHFSFVHPETSSFTAHVQRQQRFCSISIFQAKYSPTAQLNCRRRHFAVDAGCLRMQQLHPRLPRVQFQDQTFGAG